MLKTAMSSRLPYPILHPNSIAKRVFLQVSPARSAVWKFWNKICLAYLRMATLIRSDQRFSLNRFLLRLWLIMPIAAFAQGGDNCAAALLNPLTLPANITGHTTSGMNNDYTSSISGCGYNSFKDEADYLYAFTPAYSGPVTVTFEVTAACGGWVNWGAIFVFQGCPNVGTCIASATTSSNPVTLTFTVTAGNTYFLWIDSWTCGASGWVTYNLSVSAPSGGGPSCPSSVSDNGIWTGQAPGGGTLYNAYASVVNIPNNTTLEVDDVNGFGNCDLVMIVQMKGADVNLTPGSNYGRVTNMNLAGRYEINRIQNINSNRLTLVSPMSLPFCHNDIVQVIRIPYNSANPNVTLSGAYAAPPFDGRKGGIMVVYAPGTLTLNNATLNVRGRGYRGGDAVGAAWGCGFVSIPPPYYLAGPDQGPAAPKGESFTRVPAGHELARGAIGHAGGGGLNVNAGGGGGSHAGAGGAGGGDWISCNPRNDANGGGIAGYTTALDPNRLLGGGGGGGGHAGNNVPGGGDGGSGGGVVLLVANTITLVGANTIDARGADAPNVNGQWAGGGGGAGGMVYLSANAFGGTGTLTVNTSGGRGGNAYWPNQLGPGGGGGGGRLLINTATLPPTITHISNGGAAGLWCTQPDWSVCSGTYYNTPGSVGQTATSQPRLTITPPTCTPLSQTAITLYGVSIGREHRLHWTSTTPPAQIQAIEVEAASQGTAFQVIATLPASLREYTWQPSTSRLLYRIRETHQDNSILYSNVVEIASEESNIHIRRVGDRLLIENYIGAVEIYNLLGQRLLNYPYNPGLIDLTGLPTPLVVRLDDGSWKVLP
jgi:hypothetical protein